MQNNKKIVNNTLKILLLTIIVLTFSLFFNLKNYNIKKDSIKINELNNDNQNEENKAQSTNNDENYKVILNNPDKTKMEVYYDENEKSTFKIDESSQTSIDNTKQTQTDDSKKPSVDNTKQTQTDNLKKPSVDNTKQTQTDDSKKLSVDNTKKTQTDNSKNTSVDNTKQTQTDDSKNTSVDNTKQTKTDNTKQTTTKNTKVPTQIDSSKQTSTTNSKIPTQIDNIKQENSTEQKVIMPKNSPFIIDGFEKEIGQLYDFRGYYTEKNCQGIQAISQNGDTLINIKEKNINDLYACYKSVDLYVSNYSGTAKNKIDGLILNVNNNLTNAYNTEILQSAINYISSTYTKSTAVGKITLPSGIYYFSQGGGNNVSEKTYFKQNPNEKTPYVIKAKSYVKIIGSGIDKTILKASVDNTKYSGGVDFFHYVDYNDGENNFPVIIENGNKSVIYLTDMYYKGFTIDMNEVKCGSYNSSGAGFRIPFSKNTTLEYIKVDSSCATAYGIDYPVNVKINYCYAINSGKSVNGETAQGGSGFGIGTGYRKDESIVISNSYAYNNGKFGFFFEHQAKFGPSWTKNQSTTNIKPAYIVKNSYAGGNMYDFGALKGLNVEFNGVKGDSGKITSGIQSVDYTLQVNESTSLKKNIKLNNNKKPYYVAESSVNINVKNSTFNIIGYNKIQEFYNEAVKWGVNNGIILIDNEIAKKNQIVNVSAKVDRKEIANIIYRYFDLPGKFIVKDYKTETPKNLREELVSYKFQDLKDSKYNDYLDSILWLAKNGVISSDTHFNPDNLCKREEFVAMLYRLSKSNEVVTTQLPFNDVSKSEWYYNAVAWAYKHKITQGTSSTSFGIGQTITYEQAITMLYKYDQIY